MRIKKYRLFFNFEKEEAWLNKMAQKGLHFVEYKFGRYFFEQGTPGEYIYRIDMLETWIEDEQSLDYIEFMTESGVEMVSTFSSWVYFRKKAEDGPFEIYSDIPSRIKHYEKIARVYGIVFLVNFVIAIFNMYVSTFNLYLSVVNFLVAIIILVQLLTLLFKIKHLKGDSEIFDR